MYFFFYLSKKIWSARNKPSEELPAPKSSIYNTKAFWFCTSSTPPDPEGKDDSSGLISSRKGFKYLKYLQSGKPETPWSCRFAVGDDPNVQSSTGPHDQLKTHLCYNNFYDSLFKK